MDGWSADGLGRRSLRWGDVLPISNIEGGGVKGSDVYQSIDIRKRGCSQYQFL